MTDPFVHDDAAYVLGALSAAEQTAFEEHLAGCDACRARVREIEDVTAVLPDVRPDEVLDDLIDEGLPDTVLAGLLRRVETDRRRRTWLVTGLAAVAAACLVALVLAVWPSGGASSGRPVPRALSPVVASPVRAEAALIAKPWGTQIDLRCRYTTGVDGAHPYLLLVTDRRGRPERLGTWTLPAGQEMSFSAGTALRPSQIGRVEVSLPDGTPILRLRN